MATVTASSESDFFARIIAGDEGLPASFARRVLTWKIPHADLKRIAKLQQKNNDGSISAAEFRQLEAYVRVGQFLSVLQAQARLKLKNRGKK
jgi:hypothetical protein